MLLFGFLLLITASVAAEYDYCPVKLCIDDGRVRTLILPWRPGPETNDCISFGDSALVIYLNLRRRCIKSFNKGWFGLAPYVHSIDLSYNEITEITSEILNDQSSYLKKVYMRHNNIQRLRNGTLDLTNVRLIDLSHNSIFDIERGALQKVPRLRTFILTGNQLKDLEFVATLPPHLKRIFLGNNDIEALPDRLFAGAPKLEVLNFAYNNIQLVGSVVLEGIRNLYSVDFSFNPFTKFKKAKLLLKLYRARQDET